MFKHVDMLKVGIDILSEGEVENPNIPPKVSVYPLLRKIPYFVKYIQIWN